ncbi:MAG: dTDP-glucose 4,6-dehydratase [Acidimicrobiales bacterium]
MTLLVTGGAGFIGSNFVRHWLAGHPGEVVVVYDALTYAGNRASLADVEGQIVFVRGDVCDLGAARSAIAANGVDVVVHFAAESHNSLAVLDPGRFFRTNVIGTQTMCEAARCEGVRRFHHISTCEVYGDLALDSPERFTESSPYRPRTPYNASKAGADHAVRAYGETYGLAITITNCCNNYGPFQFPEKVVPLFAALALDDQPLPMYASTENRREWLHVADHCRAVELVIESGRVGETYHVGSGVEASITEIADGVLAATGRPPSLKTVVPDRPGHDRRYLLDSTKLRTELGWEPLVSFADGLADTVAWYGANRQWWEPLMGRSPVSEGSWGSAAGPAGVGAAAGPAGVGAAAGAASDGTGPVVAAGPGDGPTGGTSS